MQARRPPRIRCSSVSVYPIFYFLFYILSFTFFLPTPNPLPSGKRALSLRSLAFLPSLLSTHIYCLQAHPLRWMGHFLLGLFKERAVAMGKPHCNRSICTFWFCTHLKVKLGGCLCLVYCVLVIPAKPPKLGRFLAGHLVIKRRQKIIENFAKIMILALATFFQNIIWPSNFT